MFVNFNDYLICFEKLRDTTKILFDQSKPALWNSKDYYNRKKIIYTTTMCCTQLYDSSQPCISPLKNTPSKDAAFDNCRKNYSSNFSSFREFPNVVDWPYLHCTLNNRGGSTVSSIFIIPTKKSLILAQKLERIIILGRNFSRKINKNCKEL